MDTEAEGEDLGIRLVVLGFLFISYIETDLKDPTTAEMATLVLVSTWFLHDAPGFDALLTSELAYIVALVLVCGFMVRAGASSVEQPFERES